MGHDLTIEFFKMAQGNGVGVILETVPMHFADEHEFHEWAQKALPSRRGDDRIWEWPDAVRALGTDGHEKFRWSLWDQINARKPLSDA